MQNKIKKFFDKAFTLAEVIIVIGIIGIVAEMVLPDLVFNYQKQIYTTQLKRMTSNITNAFRQAMATSNCNDMACTGIISGSANTTVDNINAANIFKINKICYMMANGCHDKQLYNINNNSAGTMASSRHAMIVFNDGSLMSIYNTAAACNRVPGTNKYAATCNLDGVFDVNGEKSPNTYGKDIFYYYLSNSGYILPAGVSDDTNTGYWNTAGNTNNCISGSGNGKTCFGRIMEKGWQMDY